MTSILKPFFAVLVAADKGHARTVIDLSTGQECSDALINAKLFNHKAYYQYQGSWQPKHKECFICDSGEMCFNLHFTGGNQAGSSRSICKKTRLQIIFGRSVITTPKITYIQYLE